MPVQQHQPKWITTISFFAVFCAILVGCVNGKTGFKCYTCVSQNDDKGCLENPGGVQEGSPTVECDQEENDDLFGWCTVVRQEYTDIPGKIAFLRRDCLRKQPPLEGVYPDSQYTFYYYSCRTHLCNIGNGLQPFPGNGGGGGSGSGGDGGDIIFVDPERRGASMSVHSSSILFVLSALSLVFLSRNNIFCN